MRYDLTRPDARPWLYGIATTLVGRHRRDESRFWRLVARTGADHAVDFPGDQIADRVSADCGRNWRPRSPGCRAASGTCSCSPPPAI
jgi:hypothetical protein